MISKAKMIKVFSDFFFFTPKLAFFNFIPLNNTVESLVVKIAPFWEFFNDFYILCEYLGTTKRFPLLTKILTNVFNKSQGIPHTAYVIHDIFTLIYWKIYANFT